MVFRVRDIVKNTISARNAELALTMGTMFSTDEALKIGLIDEIATDKADAVAKAERFLSKTTNIPGITYSNHITTCPKYVNI